MLSIEKTCGLLIFWLGALAAGNCQVSKQSPGSRTPPSCQAKLALWKAEFPKIPPGPPAARINRIEGLADRIGEDPEQCAGDLIRQALQAERTRFITLAVNRDKIPAAAVYTCATLSKDLKCISSIADDTAHLGEALVPVLPLTGGQRVKFERDVDFSRTTMRVYVAVQSTLLDGPKYSKLTLDKTGAFTLPRLSEQIVLLTIIKEPRSGLYDKFVWLLKPR